MQNASQQTTWKLNLIRGRQYVLNDALENILKQMQKSEENYLEILLPDHSIHLKNHHQTYIFNKKELPL